MMHKLLVVGGNGFVGSAVCKVALSRGWDVTSISTSGNPFRTPKGHTPTWTTNVTWHTASALDPCSYRALLRDKTAVVHTVGTLLETAQYKEAVRTGDVVGLARTVFGSIAGGDGGNPLTRGAGHPGSYETLNRDTALRVCETYLSVVDGSEFPVSEFGTSDPSTSRTFVYISAEDLGRPFIPRRYLSSKRDAEHGIAARCEGTRVRNVFIRPSLIYHPHIRPITSPLAALVSLSATLHQKAPAVFPMPGRVLEALGTGFGGQSLSKSSHHSSSGHSSSNEPLTSNQSDSFLPSPFLSLSNALTLPPIHVDHVGEAVCIAVERRHVTGEVGVREMREWVGVA